MTYETAKQIASGRSIQTSPWSKETLREYQNFSWEPRDMELHLCPTAKAALDRLRAQPAGALAKGAAA